MSSFINFSEIEPIFVAYGALLVGAVLPIVAGSFGSLQVKISSTASKALKKSSKHHDSEDSEEDDEEEQSESLSSEDAMWFPIMGSGTLFGLYLLFKYFGKEYINYLLTAYFSLLGTGSLAKLIHSLLSLSNLPNLLPWNEKFKLQLVNRKTKKNSFKFNFDYLLIGCGIGAACLSGYYVYTKNWIASNIFGEAFSVSAIQLLDLDDFKTGMILLSGLFFYDIFWVFGTEVMVSVAKNFDAPVKILFPKNLFADKLEFTMLGLGDIVIPGIFIALCLRFDHFLYQQQQQQQQQKQSKNVKKSSTLFVKPYFYSCIIAYILGLVTTIVVMHTFKAAQPALLYLSPACILSTLLTAAVRGELSLLFSYKSTPQPDSTDKINDETAEAKDDSRKSRSATPKKKKN